MVRSSLRQCGPTLVCLFALAFPALAASAAPPVKSKPTGKFSVGLKAPVSREAVPALARELKVAVVGWMSGGNVLLVVAPRGVTALSLAKNAKVAWAEPEITMGATFRLANEAKSK